MDLRQKTPTIFDLSPIRATLDNPLENEVEVGKGKTQELKGL